MYPPKQSQSFSLSPAESVTHLVYVLSEPCVRARQRWEDFRFFALASYGALGEGIGVAFGGDEGNKGCAQG